MQSASSLTQGSIGHRLFEFTLPVLLSMILQSLNSSVNTIWIGRYLGEAALTASSNANTMMFVVTRGILGASMASTILIAQCLGAHRLLEAKRVVGTSATFFTATACAISVSGWIFSEQLLVWMGTPAKASALAVAYLHVIFFALPFMSLFTLALSVLRGAADTRTAMYFMGLSVALDVTLNPIFIFGIGPAPRLGLAGSALATLIAQAFALLMLITYLYRRKYSLCVRRGELALLSIDWSIASKLITKGIPMALQLIVMIVSMVLMMTLVNRFGVNTAAAYGASMQVWSYVQIPAFALSMTVSAIAAQSIGAGKWDRVAATTRMGLLFGIGGTVLPFVLTQAFDRFALGLFLPAGSPALELAIHMNHIVSWSYMLFGLSLILFGVVRASGAVMAPLFILVCALLMVRFPFAELLMPSLGADAIWWSFPLAATLALLFATAYYKQGGWRTSRMMQLTDPPL